MTKASAAIEFAIVALPFFLFVFGIIGFGLYFLASTLARVRRRVGGA